MQRLYGIGEVKYSYSALFSATYNTVSEFERCLYDTKNGANNTKWTVRSNVEGGAPSRVTVALAIPSVIAIGQCAPALVGRNMTTRRDAPPARVRP